MDTTPDTSTTETPSHSWTGRRLGPYQLLHLLGTGGMGEVYFAERVDKEFEQRVAIKLVRRDLIPVDVYTRLRTERQILANLQHPNIARLFDGGTAEDGTPYLVMEYIDGTPINVYCDRHRLSIQQRLHLFCKVCAAVQYAHQSLIVHRDLKASNILVTDEGEPKLLDFGIAKLLNEDSRSTNPQLTQHGLRVMTPAHASPEQVSGDSITTASDIYALGLLLYQLLCGKRAITLQANARMAEIQRLVCELIPTLPSEALLTASKDNPQLAQDIAFTRRTNIKLLHKLLKGDLNNIVMMALRKEPHRRYLSGTQFAEDIQHWLSGQPVTATQDSWSYRSSKFVQRHRYAVATGAMMVVMLSAFSVVTYMQSQALTRERDAVTLERNRAQQVSSFLVELFELSDPAHNRGHELKAQELLEVGTRRIESDLKSYPETRATLLNTIGRVYNSLGLYKEASAILEKSLALRQHLYGRQHQEFGTSLNDLSETQIALGELDTAEKALQESLQSVSTENQKQNFASKVHAKSLFLLGRIALERGEFDAAEQRFKQSMRMYDALGQQNSIDKASVMTQLGKALSEQYKEAEAEPWLRAALNIGKVQLGQDHPQVAEQMARLADALEGQGKYEEAANWFRDSLNIKRRILGARHPDTVDTIENYGNFLRRNGDFDEARALLNEALQLNTELHGQQHEYVGYDNVNLGLLDYDQGRYASAEYRFRAALNIYEHSLGQDSVLIAGAQIGLARSLTRQGNPNTAITLLHSAMKIADESLGKHNPITATANAALGIALLESGHHEKAKALLLQTLTEIEDTYGSTAVITREVNTALNQLGAKE
jgi:serine/threonine-protein kinase